MSSKLRSGLIIVIIFAIAVVTIYLVYLYGKGRGPIKVQPNFLGNTIKPDQDSLDRAHRYFEEVESWYAAAVDDNGHQINEWYQMLLRGDTLPEELHQKLSLHADLADAAMKTICSGKFGADPAWVEDLPPLFSSISLAKHQALLSVIEMERADTIAGCARLIRVRQMGRRFQDDGPWLIGHLVGIAIESIANSVLTDQLSRRSFSHRDLEKFENVFLESALKPPDMDFIWKSEYEFMASRMNTKPLNDFFWPDDPENPGPQAFFEHLSSKFLFDKQECADIHAELLTTVAQDSRDDIYLAGERRSEFCKPLSREKFSRTNEWGYRAWKNSNKLYQSLEQRNVHLARSRLLLLGIRAERFSLEYGTLPESLETLAKDEPKLLVNPTSGEKWKYVIGKRIIAGEILKKFCPDETPENLRESIEVSF